MSLYVVPIYVTVRADDDATAKTAQKSIQAMLGQGMVPAMLRANGVPYVGHVVGEPTRAKR